MHAGSRHNRIFNKNLGVRFHFLFIVLFNYLSFLGNFESETDRESFDTFATENGIVNDRPIIGILTRHSRTPDTKYGDEFVDAKYVHYLEMGGARVVPIRPKRDRQYYERLFKSINGVFYPGGGVNLYSSTYRETGQIMFELAVEANNRGVYFPIWGTCLGFELLLTLIAETPVTKPTYTKNMTLPLKFVHDYERSRLFQHMPKQLIKHLSEEKSAMHNNKFGVLLEVYENSSKMKDFYRILTTGHYRGQEFVSTIEAYKYPFYAVQWHPEKNVFSWSENLIVNQSYRAIKTAQYLAHFFVNEARKNSHHFHSIVEEAHAHIRNAKRVFVPDFKIGERFYFNYTDDSIY